MFRIIASHPKNGTERTLPYFLAEQQANELCRLLNDMLGPTYVHRVVPAGDVLIKHDTVVRGRKYKKP